MDSFLDGTETNMVLVEAENRTEAYEEFIQKLGENYPLTAIFLQKLVTNRVIKNSQKEEVMELSRIPALYMLFAQIMPHRDLRCHRELIKVLRNDGQRDNAEFLFRNLFIKSEKPAQKSAPLQAAASAPGLDELQLSDSEDAATIPKYKTSHNKDDYEKEIKDQNIDFPIPDGPLTFQVQPMMTEPPDLKNRVNNYYNNFSDPNKTKGLALLINNYDFGHPDNNRRGSMVDFINMKNLLQQLEYEVVDKTDLTGEQMLSEVKTFARRFNEKENSGFKSCIVVIMTHGLPGQLEGIDGSVINEAEVFDIIMTNKGLAGKPKIFIIQACRGTEYHRGVYAKPDGGGQSKQSMLQEIPAGADTCIMHSTTPGYFSWRGENNGSWFIQEVCKEFSKHAHQPWADLLTLAVRVTDKVASAVIPRAGSKNAMQLPHTVSNMRKKFHFFPHYPPKP